MLGVDMPHHWGVAPCLTASPFDPKTRWARFVEKGTDTERLGALLIVLLAYFFFGFAGAFLVGFSASRVEVAVENLTTFLAGILIEAPVRGFLPVLAALVVLEKEPSPGRATLSFFASASLIVSTTAESTLSA